MDLSVCVCGLCWTVTSSAPPPGVNIWIWWSFSVETEVIDVDRSETMILIYRRGDKVKCVLMLSQRLCRLRPFYLNTFVTRCVKPAVTYRIHHQPHVVLIRLMNQDLI